jgi:UDP:flavonoid glycosyltransferase YjiC (YdhE family)
VDVLLTTIPSHGHLHPLVPVARALRERGHSVAVATAPDFAAAVEATGLPAIPAGVPEAELVARMERRAGRGAAAPGEWGLTMFAEEAAPPMVRELLDRDTRPDLVVHEEGEWGGPVAAAVAGVPSVAVGWGAPLWTREELRLIDSLVRPLWARHAVTPRSPAGLFDHLYLDTCPPTLQSGAIEAIAAARPMRREPVEGADEMVEAHDSAEPQVYVTLGTVPTFNRDPQLLAAIVEALSRESMRILVTVGPGNDPTFLPEQARLRVEQYLPQSQALAGSALAVTHGGAGSTVGALACGLPVLVLPRGAPSQRRMASACVAAGVGIALENDQIDESAVRTAVRRLLDHSGYRRRAEAVRDELAQLPPPADAVRWLERLVRSDYQL